MSKKQTIPLRELKVGDEVEIVIKTKILQIGSDGSIGVEGAEGSTWMWPSDHKSIEFRVPARPLIPDDATAVSYRLKVGGVIFAAKNSNGTWTDVDEDSYEDTAALIAAIRKHGQTGSIKVYDRRGA